MRGLALLLGLGLLTAAEAPSPGRAELAAVEHSMYTKLRSHNIDQPIEVLGLPRGIYLPSYGAVFTAEVSLVQTPGISPFRPAFSKEDVARVRAAKEKRLPEMRQLMRQMLLDSAASLDRLPAQEQVVLGMVLYYNTWEDRGRLPQMITMQARRQALLDVVTNRAPRASLDTSIQVREE